MQQKLSVLISGCVMYLKGTTFCAGILFDGPAYPLSITLLSCAILKAFGKGEVTSLS